MTTQHRTAVLTPEVITTKVGIVRTAVMAPQDAVVNRSAKTSRRPADKRRAFPKETPR